MRLTLSLVLLLAIAAPGFAGDTPAEKPRPLAIGEEVPSFELKDLDGNTFRLADARTVDEGKVLEVLIASAKKAAPDAEVTAETTLASLKPLQDESGALDVAKTRAMLQMAAKPYGLIVGEETHEDLDTIGDVASWLAESANAPIVFMCWSPMCPTSRGYEPRIMALIAETGARLYPLASNGASKERDEDCVSYVAKSKLPYRVLLDREQVACDRLGGLVTPHVFLVDAENRLAYAGSIDSDPRQKTNSAEERQNWLTDAIEAATNGSPIDIQRTRAKG